ncbi:unnamed protein product [Cylindrotheca closterium]|uniref:TraB domain-containing protein n=1 Tax=Cylindrotheca closterium TaxID=2856 RepID=A0AAD2G5Q3_9STRA|nr:unnamed protein product [Cylindrotheca closterium]
MSFSSSEMQALVSKGLLAQPLPNLYVLGTIHIGSKSADDVNRVLNSVQPSTVIVELPPSRLPTILKSKNIMQQYSDEIDGSKQKIASNPRKTSLIQVIATLPSMAGAGLSIAGFPGMMVMISLLWPSLVKQTWSLKNSEQKGHELERRNEFEVAVAVANILGASVVAADWELEELVQRLASSLTVLDWIQLMWGGLVLEPLGIQPIDPLQRKSDESSVEWEERRRDIWTARASLEHAQTYTPAVDQVLVHGRNQYFAELCLKEIYSQEETMEGEGNVGSSQLKPIVCIVGLAHVDGVCEICRKQADIYEVV